MIVTAETYRQKDDKGNWNAAQIAPIPSDLAVNWWEKKILFRFSSPVFIISPLFIFCLLILSLYALTVGTQIFPYECPRLRAGETMS
jgi:hypothetical protein